MQNIGMLSSRYESNGDPGAIGYDPSGGWSYGQSQIETAQGTFGFFMAYCQSHYPDIYQKLTDAGGYAAAKAGTTSFKATWKEMAQDDPAFATCQHDFIVDQFYGAAIKRLQAANIDLSTPPRTFTLANVIYSMSVMAGAGSAKANGAGGCGLVFDALTSLNAVANANSVTDEALVDAIYNQKLVRIDTGREYRTQPASIKASVRNRVVHEHTDAVVMLTKERNFPGN